MLESRDHAVCLNAMRSSIDALLGRLAVETGVENLKTC